MERLRELMSFVDEDIEQNFSKFSRTTAQCRHCEETFLYVKHDEFTQFFMHVEGHANIFEKERQPNLPPLWKYIRVGKMREKYNCLLCDEYLENETTWANHISIHANKWNNFYFFNHFFNHFYGAWPWKYCEQVNDFKIMCSYCSQEISIVFRWSELMSHIKQNHASVLTEVALNFEDKEIQEKFTKLTLSKAQCKVCSYKCIHTNMRNFNEHMITHHTDIEHLMRDYNEQGYFKYARFYQVEQDLGYQCVLCKVKFTNQNELEHIHAEDDYTSLGKYYDEFQWKHRKIKQNTDSKVRCYYCPEEISIDFRRDDLMNHIKKCQPSLSITDLGLNIQDVEILNKFKNFSNAKAKCKKCELDIAHTSIENFNRHIHDTHEEIVLFETEFLVNPQYVRYKRCCSFGSLNFTGLIECVLCKILIDHDEEAARFNAHEPLHEHNDNYYTLIKRNYEEWEWKYCEREDNCTVRCNYCLHSQNRISIDFDLNNLKTHLNICENNQEPSNLLTPDVQDEEIRQLFNSFSSTKAKCNICKITISHTNIIKFITHLKQMPHEWLNYAYIVEFENYIIEKKPLWKYIKLRKDSFYECVLCKGKIVNLDTEFSCHTHEDDVWASRGKDYEKWQLKYCEKRTRQNRVLCGICKQISNVACSPLNLKLHKNCGLQSEKHQQKRLQKEDVEKMLWKHYRRFWYNEIKCKKCEKLYTYININSLRDHLNKNHKYIIEFKKRNPDKSYRNMKQLEDLSYKCTICQQKVLEVELLSHECKEDTVLPAKQWEWDYFVRLSDLCLKCDICPIYFKLQFHSNIIQNVKIHGNSCLRSLQIDTDTVWQHFEKKSNTRAICKLCQPNLNQDPYCVKYAHIKKSLFLTHIAEQHFEIFKFSTEKQSIEKWKYVKYFGGHNVCVVCDEIVCIDEFDIHIHNDFLSYTLLDYEDWPWKYCVTFNDSCVCCDICKKIIEIEYDTSAMKAHLENTHSATIRKDVGLEDAGGPSFLTTTQQQDIVLKDTAGALSSSGTSRSPGPSPEKKQKRD